MSDIYCIFTVTYCKYTVHSLSRATVLHWTALYLPTDQHCTAIYETVWGTDQHCTPLYTSIQGTDQHSGTVTHCTYVFYPI